MVVRWSHVKDGQSEYTVDCGWIDWSHATPNRDDINTIWGGLPSQNNKSKPDVRIRDRTTKKEHEYWKVRVPHLKGDAIDWTATWYVRYDGFQSNLYYKRAALAL